MAGSPVGSVPRVVLVYLTAICASDMSGQVGCLSQYSPLRTTSLVWEFDGSYSIVRSFVCAVGRKLSNVMCCHCYRRVSPIG